MILTIPVRSKLTVASTAELDAQSPYHRIGGLAVLRQITNRFYDLMEQEPEFAELRAMHGADLAPMRDSLASFLAGWSGGPRDWSLANPGKCMGSVHAPFAITAVTARQWVTAMRRAIADVAPQDTEMADAFATVMERMALGMARG